MVNVAAIVNPIPEDRQRWADPQRRTPPPWQARYLDALQPWSELGESLRRQGGRGGGGQGEHQHHPQACGNSL